MSYFHNFGLRSAILKRVFYNIPQTDMLWPCKWQIQNTYTV